ncbi:hypothetical protein PP707_05675, partial [Acetobacter pasteurianus]|nr:hypothetical protein [Acetobacter pasteurianus]
MENVFTVNNVVLNRRGLHILGTLILSSYHLVFTFQSPTTNTNTSTNTSTSTNTATNSNTSATPSSIVAQKPPPQKEIWICYPIIERISKARGSTWLNNNPSNDSNDRHLSSNSLRKSIGSTAPKFEGFDNYSASHIRLQCKDFTYFSFDFKNDLICCEVFNKMSSLITRSKVENSNNSNSNNNNNNNSLKLFYAYSYVPNSIEQNLPVKGWDLYDPFEEYDRLGLLPKDGKFWRVTNINEDYKFCPSYPRYMIVPGSISDNVLKHAGKFRSKQRIPAVVYKHKGNVNGNVIARCAQPLVGLNLQNRSIQDEKLIGEIFHSQELERNSRIAATAEDSENNDRDSDSDVEYQSQQPQRNLLVDLRPITNAMAQHALGAGTENVDNYRNKKLHSDAYSKDNGHGNGNSLNTTRHVRQVDKIFCNIDNIHVVRDSLNKLTTILNDLDKYLPPQASLLPAQNQSSKVSSQHEDDQIEKENEKKEEKEKEREKETETETEKEQKQREKQQQLKHRLMKQLNGSSSTALQQALTKTQWLHRLSIILQSV